MRRLIFLLLFFASVVYLYEDIIGLMLKTAVRIFAKSRLAYRDLRISNGQLLLEDAILFDVSGGKSAYLLRSEAIWIDWTQLFVVSIRLTKPRLTLSSDVFKNRPLQGSDGRVAFHVQMDDGILDWSDVLLPPAKFSYVADALSIQWDSGALVASKTATGWQIVGTEIPAEFLSCCLPISDVSGSLSSTMHLCVGSNALDIALQAQGGDLSFCYDSLRYGGSFTLDWEAKQFNPLHMESALTGTERCRLLIERGFIRSDMAMVQEAEILGTYHAGAGAQWEGKASMRGLEDLPMTFEGQAFGSSWAGGKCRFGNAEGHITWKDEAWQVAWKGLGPAEGAILQGFAMAFDKRALGLHWYGGTVQGLLEFGGRRGFHWERVEGEEIAIHVGSLDARCARIALQEEGWSFQDAWIKGPLPVEFRGNASGNLVHKAAVFEGILGEEHAVASLVFDTVLRRASFIGAIGDLHFEGTASRIRDAEVELSIPCFEGKIPAWMIRMSALPIQGGWISSKGVGFEARGKWADAWQLMGWAFDCRAKEIEMASQHWRVSGLEGELYADQEAYDWINARGELSVAFGEKVFRTWIASPRVHWTREGNASFDLRLQQPEWDVLRIVGTKQKALVQIDPNTSHVLNAPLLLDTCRWDGGTCACASVQASISWELLESFLQKQQIDLFFAKEFAGDLELKASFETGGTLALDGCATDWKWRSTCMPFAFHLERLSPEVWQLPCLEAGPLSLSCTVSKERGAWRIRQGKAALRPMGLSFDFHGKLSQDWKMNLSLEELQADLSRFGSFIDPSLAPMQGMLEGQGCVVLTSQAMESDLDLMAKNISWNEIRIENEDHPLHLYLSSEQKACLTGIGCRIAAGDLEAHASADFVEFDLRQGRLGVRKARVHMPSSLMQHVSSCLDSNSIIDVFGDGEYFFHEHRWHCNLQEALIPLFGSLRHIKEAELWVAPHLWSIAALCSHQGKWASIEALVKQGERLQGQLQLEELGIANRTALSIRGSYLEEEGLSIDAIEGAFAGVDASFRASQRKGTCTLVGSAQIDFQRLSEWIPPHVAEGFRELEMGKGYALKGKLAIAKKDPSEFAFQGLFCGKEIDLFGYQFKTLMAEVEIKPKDIRLSQLKISDLAGSLQIDEMHLGAQAKEPWTIAIPQLVIRDLRPSLLRKPLAAAKPLTPLVVRHLAMTDFRGLLDEGKTYTAHGRLSFLNSFKRESTVFDLPSHVFGRIIGLDLELLIPVAGDLSFALQDGFFQLTELKNAFSEGERSEFFLVHSETSPRMDLRGNLEILVTMKQFVLFALTEAFMISIDGKLSDPQFSLQKKRRFL